MDPISLTASLLTLIAAAGQSCKVITEFVLDIHDAPKEIHAQLVKLQCLQRSFCQLLGVFRSLPPDFQLGTDLKRELTSFVQDIDNFKEKVKVKGIRLGQGRVQHAWERVKWLANDRDLKKFNQSLDEWDRIFAASASAAQLSLSKRILEHTTTLIEFHRGAPESPAPAEQTIVCLPQGASINDVTRQSPDNSIPDRLSMFLATHRDLVDIKIQERIEYIGDTMTATVQSGRVMVRSWSNTGQDTYRLLPAAEAYGLASVLQLTRLFPGRLSLKILATYSASSMFQIDVKCRLSFAGLLSLDSSAYDAAATGNWLFLRDMLVNREIKTTHRTTFGDTLLHIATTFGQVEVVRGLLLNAADANATNDDGDTPLHIAVQIGCDPEIIGLLLKHGANVHHQNRRGRTPLHCYYNTGLKNTIQYCHDDMDNTTQDYLGMTVAHYTAYSKSSTPEDMAFCVKDNKNAFATRDIDGRTLLHLALQRGNIALIRYILNNPRAKDALLLSDWEGQMPLHFAIASPRTRAIDLVLDAGCDIHATDLRGRTALHRAASEGNSLAVQKLLEKGAMSDLQRRDLEGKTPLMAARWKDRKEVEEYLRPLCGGSDEDGDEVDGGPWDNLEIHEGLKSHAFWEYWMLQKRLFILLIGFGVLLIYMVRYADWHKNSRVVDS